MITSDSQDIFGRKFIKEETRSRVAGKEGKHRIVTADDKTIAYTSNNQIQFVPLTSYNNISTTISSLTLSNNSFELKGNDANGGATINFVPLNKITISYGDSYITWEPWRISLSEESFIDYVIEDEIISYKIITTKEINEHNIDIDSHSNIIEPITERVTEIETEKNKLIINRPSTSENLKINSINFLQLDNYSPKSGSEYQINSILTKVLNSFANTTYDYDVCDTCEVWLNINLSSLGNSDDSTEVIINNPENIDINWIDDEFPTFYNMRLYSIIFRRIPISSNEYIILANVAYETKIINNDKIITVS